MPCENNYTRISQFGHGAVTHPLTYSIGDSVNHLMMHGSSSAIISGQHSKNSQIFLANYCANTWDDFCEIASTDHTVGYANNMNEFMGPSYIGLTHGDMLLLNTARVKYLVDPGNQILHKEQFDPNVANSPYIYYWKQEDHDTESARRGHWDSDDYGPKYAVNPETIDSDVVMNKILCNPQPFTSLLCNIHHTMQTSGTLGKLQETKLGAYFMTNQFVYGKR